MGEESAKLDNGTNLAGIGGCRCAPFVGLFGTVWGGATMRWRPIGQARKRRPLDQVAGPVGEALIMTALGFGCGHSCGYWPITFFLGASQTMLAEMDSFCPTICITI